MHNNIVMILSLHFSLLVYILSYKVEFTINTIYLSSRPVAFNPCVAVSQGVISHITKVVASVVEIKNKIAIHCWDYFLRRYTYILRDMQFLLSLK